MSAFCKTCNMEIPQELVGTETYCIMCLENKIGIGKEIDEWHEGHDCPHCEAPYGESYEEPYDDSDNTIWFYQCDLCLGKWRMEVKYITFIEIGSQKHTITECSKCSNFSDEDNTCNTCERCINCCPSWEAHT